MTNKDEAFDQAVAKFENRVEAGVLNWVRNDQFFNGLRNSPARILLAIFSVGVLYGYGWYAYSNQGNAGYIYPVLLGFAVLLQKLSVRFVFDDDSIIDEYQHKRRNRAYRRAYKWVGAVLSVLIWVVAAKAASRVVLTAQSGFWPLPNGQLHVEISVYGAYIGSVFLIGLFTIQKYLSWGFRGEPMR